MRNMLSQLSLFLSTQHTFFSSIELSFLFTTGGNYLITYDLTSIRKLSCPLAYVDVQTRVGSHLSARGGRVSLVSVTATLPTRS